MLSLDGEPADPAVAAAMSAAIDHRGPDGQGVWHEGPICLGHRHLAIRDLSSAADQPFHSACGKVVATYNGEIYNENELRDELERAHGLISRTTCDIELIPAGFLAWGLDLFDRLEGIFAIAIWDRTAQRLVLARDGFGVKPLYIQRDEKRLRFGSETKALLADTTWPAVFGAEQLHTLLALGHLGPAQSLIAGVEQLPPGSVRVVDQRTDRESIFWCPFRSPSPMTADGARDAVLDLLPEVVEQQLISDVPVGVLQSGGVDSTVVTLSLPESAQCSLFTVRFQDEDYDESGVAQDVAQIAGRHTQTIDLPEYGGTEHAFRQVVHYLDGETADASALAMFRLAERVREQVTVALSGDGGDELFAGYPTYAATRLAALIKPLAPGLSVLSQAARRLAGVRQERIPFWEIVARFCAGLSSAVPHTSWRRYLQSNDAEVLYGPGLRPLLEARADPLAGYAEAWHQARGNVLDRALLADQCYYLPADMLIKVDRCSMAHGLEVRVPLLDRRLAAIAASIPSSVLYPTMGPSKAVLRAAAAQLRAPTGAWRGRKRGFNVPINRLLATALHPLVDRLFGRDADIFVPYLKPDAARRLWRQHANGEINHNYALWTCLTFAVRREQLGSRVATA